MRKFFVQTKQTEGTANLYTRIRTKSPYRDWWVNTHIEIDIPKWQKCYEDIQLYAKSGKNGKEAERLALEVDKAIDNALTIPGSTKEDIQEAVDGVVFKEAKELQRQREAEIRAQQEREAEERRAAKAKEDADVILYLSGLIQRMREGKVLTEGRGNNTGEYYTANTIKMWNNLLGILRRYDQECPFTWADIDKTFAVNFRRWMEAEGYMAKSINKYIGQFIALLNRAYEDGKHTNMMAVNAFKGTKAKVSDEKKATEIYLTADELNALYKMKLTGEKAIVRDIFVVGCCTCQRVSDYSTLTKENFTTTAKGTRVVKIRQTKTGNSATIPIIDEKLDKIMQKYGYNLPQVSDVIINRYIKEIGKELSKKVKSLAVELPTILTMKERAKEERGEIAYKRNKKGQVVKPRYEMITTHTARRTGITNLYLSGKFDVYQMMAVSGHKEAKTFKEYIKLSDEEIADGIAKKMEDDNLF